MLLSQVIAKCAQGNPSTGGIVREIGSRNKLAVIVRPYVGLSSFLSYPINSRISKHTRCGSRPCPRSSIRRSALQGVSADLEDKDRFLQ